MLEAWRQERITWHGDYYDFDEIEVLPKPYQQPTPPFWVAAGGPDAIDWAAKQGYSILMDPHATNEELGDKRRNYFKSLEKYGHETEGRSIPMARLIAVAETDEEAEQIAINGAQWTIGSYANEKVSGNSSPVRQLSVDERIDRYANQVVIHGSPAKVIDQLEELRETIDLDYLIASPFSHDSFVRFTNDVMPHFQ